MTGPHCDHPSQVSVVRVNGECQTGERPYKTGRFGEGEVGDGVGGGRERRCRDSVWRGD